MNEERDVEAWVEYRNVVREQVLADVYSPDDVDNFVEALAEVNRDRLGAALKAKDWAALEQLVKDYWFAEATRYAGNRAEHQFGYRVTE
jgi:hypothetical protein